MDGVPAIFQDANQFYFTGHIPKPTLGQLQYAMNFINSIFKSSGLSKYGSTPRGFVFFGAALARVRGYDCPANLIEILLEGHFKKHEKNFIQAIIDKYSDRIELIGGLPTIKLGQYSGARRRYRIDEDLFWDNGVIFGIPVRCSYAGKGFPRLVEEIRIWGWNMGSKTVNYSEITLPNFEDKVPILRSDASLKHALESLDIGNDANHGAIVFLIYAFLKTAISDGNSAFSREEASSIQPKVEAWKNDDWTVKLGLIITPEEWNKMGLS